MKAFYLLFLTIVFNYCSAQDEPLQNGSINIQVIEPEGTIKITKDYFRSNPFDREFSKFLNHLMNDPALTNKALTRRTDSSFFFLKGEYINYSPYSFKADRTEVLLTETEIELKDSLHSKDTVFVYELLGYCYGGKEGMEGVKKEFVKCGRRYSKRFSDYESSGLKNGNIIGEIRNYFNRFCIISPVSIVWAKLDDFQNVFTITIRIKVKENHAILPISPDSN